MNKTFIRLIEEYQFLLPTGIILLTLLTLMLALLPAEILGDSRLWSFDKIGHFLIFGTWTYTLGLYRFIYTGSLPNMILIFVAGFGFGLTIELLQHFLPINRSAEPYDLLFDTLGCLAAIVLLVKTVRVKE